jgi:outer membrane protein assembly factor BamB
MNQFCQTRALIFASMVLMFVKSALGDSLPEITNLWSLRLPDTINSSLATPAIADDGTIYLGTFYGTFLAVSPAGQIKWSFDINCEIQSSAAIADDGTVYFGSRNRKFYALTPEGKLKWFFPTEGWVDSSPAIAAGGTIYFGSADGNFYALNPDGTLKWKYPAGAAVDSSPAIASDGTIYFGAHDKKLYALGSDGRVRWTFVTGGPVVSSPAIAKDGSVCFSSTDGNLYSLKSDGTELWHYHTGGMTESSPVLDEDGNIYLGVNLNVVQTISPAGKLRWVWPAPVLIDQTPAVATGRIYTTMPWGMLYALLPGEKAPVWQVRAQYNLSSSPAVDAKGNIYFVGGLYLDAVQPPDGVMPDKQSSWPQFRANPRHTGRVAL